MVEVLSQTSDRSAEFETQDLLLNVGPQHPSTHGVFRMVMTVDGEVVRDVIPYIDGGGRWVPIGWNSDED